MQNIKTKDVIAYATMPRIVPRARKLFSSGFGYVTFLMAHIYSMVRLLPPNHPYLMAKNMGGYGIRHVIVEAARNLKFSIKNIDQIVIFFAMLAGVVMLVAQFVLLLYAVIVSPAMAASWFETANPTNDIAYNILDQVFGIPNIYCSTTAICTSYASVNAMPLPFHIALHALFRFYSTALLLIATLIFLYFVVVVIFETATSGTPFGQRFQNVWVPIRLIVALGLLMPIGYGLNSGQYITLYAAKFGSSFATNGWNEFNTAIGQHGIFSGAAAATDAERGSPTGERYTFLALPESPDITPTVEAMSLVHSCAYAYLVSVDNKPNTTDPGAPARMATDDYWDSNGGNKHVIRPFFVKSPTTTMLTGSLPATLVADDSPMREIVTSTGYSHNEAIGFYYGSDIIIRFGEYALTTGGDPVYTDDTGDVKPLCGDIRIPISDLSDVVGSLMVPPRGGPDHMQAFYFQLILDMWFADLQMQQFARAYVNSSAENEAMSSEDLCDNAALSGTGATAYGFQPTSDLCQKHPPRAQWKTAVTAYYQAQVDLAVKEAWANYVMNSIYYRMRGDIIGRGWGGAGIWYNQIAEINSGFMAAVMDIPTFDKYPLVMEQVRAEKRRHNEEIAKGKQFEPSLKAASASEPSKKFEIALGDDALAKVAIPLAAVYDYWNADIKNFDTPNRVHSSNIFIDAMTLLLGQSGLVAMRTSNAHLHPLAQLIAVGKGLVNSAVGNMAASSASAFMGGMVGALDSHKKSAGLFDAASQMFLSVAFIGLTAGFVLFYVLPFLPFVYFYFAVANWIKSIFEAMVGVPLWALAHLRIDGDGLPGDAAQNGYYLILEIFIRPILTVFGLVAAITIFATQVRVLNLIWDLVAANAAGFTPGNDILNMSLPTDMRFQRGIVDQFFFTIIYTIVCYMLALASFKLIDTIPDNILRWAGAGVSTFGDINQEQVDSLSRYATMGGMTIGNQAAGAVRDASAGAGSALGKEVQTFLTEGGKAPTAPQAAPFMK